MSAVLDGIIQKIGRDRAKLSGERSADDTTGNGECNLLKGDETSLFGL